MFLLYSTIICLCYTFQTYCKSEVTYFLSELVLRKQCRFRVTFIHVSNELWARGNGDDNDHLHVYYKWSLGVVLCCNEAFLHHRRSTHNSPSLYSLTVRNYISVNHAKIYNGYCGVFILVVWYLCVCELN